VFHFAAESVVKLMAIVSCYFTMLGLYSGKKLEVLSDGASWISDWASQIKGASVERILCWYHLRKRLHEGLSQMGLGKLVHLQWEYKIRALLWSGKKAEAVWMLWDLRSRSRNFKTTDNLIGYLLRKKKMLANYEQRKAAGLWISSTRAEGWNQNCVSARCKHKGISWKSSGVLAVALYFANEKSPISPILTKVQPPL
jgi:hypothetical protein